MYILENSIRLMSHGFMRCVTTSSKTSATLFSKGSSDPTSVPLCISSTIFRYLSILDSLPTPESSSMMDFWNIRWFRTSLHSVVKDI